MQGLRGTVHGGFKTGYKNTDRWKTSGFSRWEVSYLGESPQFEPVPISVQQKDCSTWNGVSILFTFSEMFHVEHLVALNSFLGRVGLPSVAARIGETSSVRCKPSLNSATDVSLRFLAEEHGATTIKSSSPPARAFLMSPGRAGTRFQAMILSRSCRA